MPEKKQKSGKEHPLEDQDLVRLKPILGIKPGHYLACLYGAALILILFFILLYPGIKNPGALVSVISEPWGAAVLVDGVYMEAAPCKIFVPKGRRDIEISLPGFLSKKSAVDIGSRLFASALFPLKIEIREKLTAASNSEAFISEAAEYAAWTFAGEPTATYQVPLSLSEAAYRYGGAASDPAVRSFMEDTICAASRFAITRASLRDLIRAKTLLDNQGLSPSPLSLLGSAEDVIVFLDENPEAALWLSETLQGEAASIVKSSSWYGTQYDASYKDSLKSRFAGTLQSYGNFRFLEVAVSSETRPVERYYIADAPLSPEAWELFLTDRPEWRIENREALAKNGLVDSQYLAAWDLAGSPDNAATCISWHAAKAWCEWYNTGLSAASGLEARLPTEKEWELAAVAGLGRTGEFWEWCEDPYAPLDFLYASSAAISALGSPERSLRGGAWINNPGTVDIETRASLPPQFCSPFVSFRPVLAFKGSRL